MNMNYSLNNDNNINDNENEINYNEINDIKKKTQEIIEAKPFEKKHFIEPSKIKQQAIDTIEKVMKMQQELETTSFEFSAGGGAVKAVIVGTREFKEIIIDPDAVDPEDVEMLQDLIVTAVNGALKMADDKTSESMAKLQGGIGGFPGMF